MKIEYLFWSIVLGIFAVLTSVLIGSGLLFKIAASIIIFSIVVGAILAF